MPVTSSRAETGVQPSPNSEGFPVSHPRTTIALATAAVANVESAETTSNPPKGCIAAGKTILPSRANNTKTPTRTSGRSLSGFTAD